MDRAFRKLAGQSLFFPRKNTISGPHVYRLAVNDLVGLHGVVIRLSQPLNVVEGLFIDTSAGTHDADGVASPITNERVASSLGRKRTGEYSDCQECGTHAHLDVNVVSRVSRGAVCSESVTGVP